MPDADQAKAIPGQPTDNGVSGLMHQDSKGEAEDDAKEGGQKRSPEFGVDEDVLEDLFEVLQIHPHPSFGNLRPTYRNFDPTIRLLWSCTGRPFERSKS